MTLSASTRSSFAPGLRFSFAPRLIATACVACLAGCSSDDDPAASGPDADLGAAGSSSIEEGSPLYVVSTRLRSPNGATSYLLMVDSVAESRTVDLSAALELAGTARAYGRAGGGAVYVTSSENGTMTEVTFGADGVPVPGRVLSFTGLGIGQTTGGSVNVFLSQEKAYHINQNTLEVVVWNPAAMTIIGTFPTGLSVDDGYDIRIFHQQPIIVGDQLLLVSHQSDANEITEGVTALTVVDTIGDRVVGTEFEPRCSTLLSSAVDAQGNLYFASSTPHAANSFVLGNLVPHPPCMLRIRAGETRFDPEWSRSLTADLGTSIWSGVAPGGDGLTFVQGIPEDMQVVREAVEPDDVVLARPWTWYELDPVGAVRPIETPLTAPVGSGTVLIDENEFLGAWDTATDTTTYFDTAAPGGPRPGLQVPGQGNNVVRIR